MLPSGWNLTIILVVGAVDKNRSQALESPDAAALHLLHHLPNVLVRQFMAIWQRAQQKPLTLLTSRSRRHSRRRHHLSLAGALAAASAPPSPLPSFSLPPRSTRPPFNAPTRQRAPVRELITPPLRRSRRSRSETLGQAASGKGGARGCARQAATATPRPRRRARKGAEGKLTRTRMRLHLYTRTPTPTSRCGPQRATRPPKCIARALAAPPALRALPACALRGLPAHRAHLHTHARSPFGNNESFFPFRLLFRVARRSLLLSRSTRSARSTQLARTLTRCITLITPLLVGRDRLAPQCAGVVGLLKCEAPLYEAPVAQRFQL
jgi:hypothetical protein